jgi:hypothetical protein
VRDLSVIPETGLAIRHSMLFRASPGSRVRIVVFVALGLATSCIGTLGDDALDRIRGTPNQSPLATPTTIVLPLEVMGPAQTVVTEHFNIPDGPYLKKRLKLWLEVHALRYETEASFQLNGAPWTPINSTTINIEGLGSAFGGVGGGFSTLKITLNLRVDAVQPGSNTISFRFNGTDGRTSGFRLLALNVLTLNGEKLIPPESFTQDDPSKWRPPFTSLAEIETGKELWYSARLTAPGFGAMRAKCGDCHAQDGRDLKYFNYSNLSIRARSEFHGLTQKEGDQIASYIRSLNQPNPGRPWNPPYQPGPGLDSQPVTYWSAGAGLNAVLASDQDLAKELFPNGAQASFFSPTGVLNIRETAIPLQLPDWNSWLPRVHPMDAWPDFAASGLNVRYNLLRSELVPGSTTAYEQAASTLETWMSDFQTFEIPKTSAAATKWNAAYANQIYSIALWLMVKNWELNQEFQLEDMAQTVFKNPHAESRAWLSGFPFFTSPNMLHIPRTMIDNGNIKTWEYLALIWYQEQLILNNSEYQQNGTSPIDWGYVYGVVKDVSGSDSAPQAALLNLWLSKGIQISNNGIGPQQSGTGWDWVVTDISRVVSPSWRGIWVGMPDSTRTSIYTGLVQAWLTSVRQFSPQQFHAEKSIDANQVPNRGQPDSSKWVDRIWYMIPQFRHYGVDESLINQIAAWAQTIWPKVDWTAATKATCVSVIDNPEYAKCSTEQ